MALAEAMYASSDPLGALRAAAEARVTLRDLFGRAPALADVTTNIAAYEVTLDRLDDASRDAHEALEMTRDLDLPERTVDAIEIVAAVAALRGEYERSAFLDGFAEAERKRRGVVPAGTQASVRARLSVTLERAGGPAVAAARARGAIAGHERAIAEALFEPAGE